MRITDAKTNLRLFLTFSNLSLSADLCLVLSESSNVFVSLNCFLNPVIYGFLNTAYRQSIIRTEISDVCRKNTEKLTKNAELTLRITVWRKFKLTKLNIRKYVSLNNMVRNEDGSNQEMLPDEQNILKFPNSSTRTQTSSQPANILSAVQT